MSANEASVQSAVERLTEQLNPEVEPEPQTAETQPLEEVPLEAVAPEEDLDGPEPLEEQPEEVEEPEDQSEQAVWESLDEVLQAADIDAENLPVTVKVDGKTLQVTLQEALNGYQRQADYDRLMEGVRTERRTVEEQAKEQATAFAQRGQQIDQVYGMLNAHWDAEEKAIRDYFDNLDWMRIRNETPAEYSALQTDYQQRLNLLQERRQDAAQAYQQLYDQAAQEAETNRVETLKQQQALLLQAIPEWQDAGVRAKESAEVTEFLKNDWNVTPEEFSGIVDHRVFAIARESMLYRKALSQGRQVKKDPRKLLKPGSPTPNEQRLANRKDEATHRERLRESHKEADAAALLRNRLAR